MDGNFKELEKMLLRRRERQAASLAETDAQLASVQAMLYKDQPQLPLEKEKKK